jgi:CHAD domain-containing protein
MAHLFHEVAVNSQGKPDAAASEQARDGFGSSLAAAGRAIITDARTALTDPDLGDPRAVHELRKAFKRWRALMRLLRPAVGQPAESMRLGARELMRLLSGARDAQAALDALDDLAEADVTLSPTSFATMRERMTALRDSAEDASFTPALRARVDAYLSDAEQVLDAWAVPEIPFATIVGSLALTYRKGRRALPEDWSAAAPDALHALRRRVVEHRHQLELIEPLWPKLGRVWGNEAQRLRNRLGACQDLTVLDRLTAPHRPLAPWRARLAPAIARRRTVHLRAARRLAGRLFAERPKALRKRIAALWTARESRTAKAKK